MKKISLVLAGFVYRVGLNAVILLIFNFYKIYWYSIQKCRY